MVGLYIKLHKINALVLFMKLYYQKIVDTAMTLVLYPFTCSISSLKIYVSATLLCEEIILHILQKIREKTI